MPVSKKRKKGGKPVKRQAPKPDPGAAHPEGHPEFEKARIGRPTNPFVAQNPAVQHRGSQRGR